MTAGVEAALRRQRTLTHLAWIALLTLLVAGEKLLPGGRLLGLAAGLGFIVWGALIAFS
jgi:predicted metal-binding membrane protein